MAKQEWYLVASDNQHGEGGVITHLPDGVPEQASKDGHKDIKNLVVGKVEVIDNIYPFHSPNVATLTISHFEGTIRIPREDVGKTFVVTTVGSDEIKRLLEEGGLPTVNPIAHMYNVFRNVQNSAFIAEKPFLLNGRNGLHYFTVKEDLTIEQKFGVLNNNAGLYISVVDAAEEGFAPSVLTANFSKVKVEVID